MFLELKQVLQTQAIFFSYQLRHIHRAHHSDAASEMNARRIRRSSLPVGPFQAKRMRVAHARPAWRPGFRCPEHVFRCPDMWTLGLKRSPSKIMSGAQGIELRFSGSLTLFRNEVSWPQFFIWGGQPTLYISMTHVKCRAFILNSPDGLEPLESVMIRRTRGTYELKSQAPPQLGMPSPYIRVTKRKRGGLKNWIKFRLNSWKKRPINPFETLEN